MKNLLNVTSTNNTNETTTKNFLTRLICGTYSVADRATAAVVNEAKVIDSHLSATITIRSAEKKVLLARVQEHRNSIEKNAVSLAKQVLDKKQLVAELEAALLALKAEEVVAQ